MGHYDEVVARLLATGDAAAAVRDFTAPLPDDDAAAAEGLLWQGWDTVVAAAARTDDGGRLKLIALVAGVKEEHLPDLPILGASMREAWNWTGSRAGWTGLNAFAAQLTPDVLDFLLFGLWTIRDALETVDGWEANLPAAEQWFQHCGGALASATLHGRTYGRPGALGELAERDGLTELGFSVPRWAFWRSRLQTLSPQGFRAIKRFDARIAAG